MVAAEESKVAGTGGKDVGAGKAGPGEKRKREGGIAGGAASASPKARPGYARVILRREIQKLGKAGEVVEVRAGYARNYLLPMGLAYIADPDAEKRIEAEKRREAARERKRIEALAALAEKLDGASINVTARADGDNLYGSVGPKEVAAAVRQEHNVDVPESAVVMEEHIKKIGVYDVLLKLVPDRETRIKVWVVAE
ncbi:MAG: 50S ribosomal protein L9 [Planctomycetota bacterium]|nr:50S ribosomal protein L9 [Planctomycetota bacterium]